MSSHRVSVQSVWPLNPGSSSHAELAHPNVRGWYRNPSRVAVDSLGVAYRDETTGFWRFMHPDLVFFNDVGGTIVASIIDPHGYHPEDALMKLRALATFASKLNETALRAVACRSERGR